MEKKDALRTVVTAKTVAANEALEQFIFHAESRQKFLDFAMAVHILRPVRVYLRLWDGHTMELSIAVREATNLLTKLGNAVQTVRTQAYGEPRSLAPPDSKNSITSLPWTALGSLVGVHPRTQASAGHSYTSGGFELFDR